jgi:eukaryotic-like serine/threonine-protein kinase
MSDQKATPVTPATENVDETRELEQSVTGVFTPPTQGLPAAASPAPQSDLSDLALTDGRPRLLGDYEVVRELARGGMGVVYEARQVSLQRSVALKMILGGQLSSEDSVRRFYREARAAAGLDHPNIVPIYEVGHCEGHHFFTMALVNGPSLAVTVRQEGPLAPVHAAGVLVMLAEAVDYAHRRGIIHRDLKPENVLLDGGASGQWRPRVTDFGLARTEEAVGQTVSGQVMGTPSYMAPEQARGEQQSIGPWTDVYALGGILYFVLTGHPPFTGSGILEVLRKVVDERPMGLRERGADVPAELEAICLKCLEKTATNRFASAEQFAEALRTWIATVPPDEAKSQRAAVRAAPSPSRADVLPPSGSSARPGRTRRRIATAVLILALLALGGYLARDRLASLFADSKAGVDESAADTKDAALALEATYHDFDIKAEMVGAEQDKEGVYRLVEGQPVRFRVTVGAPAYVGVWNVNPDGSILQLFPSTDDPNNFVQAGKSITVPSGDVFEAILTGGAERLWVVATTKKWDSLDGEREGPYLIFKSAEAIRRWKESQSRAFRKRKLEVMNVSERLLTYRVSPRK